MQIHYKQDALYPEYKTVHSGEKMTNQKRRIEDRTLPGQPLDWTEAEGDKAVSLTEADVKLLDAAHKYAESYEGDDRPCIQADVINAFCAGHAFATQAQAAAPVAWLTVDSTTRKPLSATIDPDDVEDLIPECVVPLCAHPAAAVEPVAIPAGVKSQRENKELARILFGMIEGGAVDRDTNIYADDYQAGDGDTFVYRAAELLVEQDAEIDMLLATINLLSEQLVATPSPAAEDAAKASNEKGDDHE